jgi:hydrogenase nickel incorporation protein HypA/HybF
MHELSLLQELLEIATAEARQRKAVRIHRIGLRVGAHSGIEPHALEFAFPVAREGTLAAQAVLDLEIVPVVAHCAQCDNDFSPADVVYRCPHCGTIALGPSAGEELVLQTLELSFDE